MKRLQLVSFLSVAMLCVGLADSAKAGIVNFTTMIDGAQANAGLGTGSLTTGSGLLMLDDVTGEVTYNITHTGFLQPEFLAHVHGPANPSAAADTLVDCDNLAVIHFNWEIES